MKDWDKLSEEELDNLTDEQIEIYKKLIYAQNGIKFPEKPKPLDAIDIPHDKTVYKVCNLEEIFFGNINEAKGLIDFLKRCVSIHHVEYTDTSYTNKYVAPGNPVDYSYKPKDFDISTQTFYSKEKLQRCQENIDTQRKLREQYNKDVNEYERINREAITATSEFLNTLSDAKDVMRHRKECAKKYYVDYLPLANNDEEIAMNFLKKAYNISEIDEVYIKNHAEDYK